MHLGFRRLSKREETCGHASFIPLGNIHEGTLHEILNGSRALHFRKDLDIASNPTCRGFVCSLYIPTTETFDAKDSDNNPRMTGTGEERNGGRNNRVSAK